MLTDHMKTYNFIVSAMWHGDMEQEEHNLIRKKFRIRLSRILITHQLLKKCQT